MGSGIAFNDDFIEPRISELLALKIGEYYINGEQIKAVEKILELENNSVEDLTAKRNSVVKLLTLNDSDDNAWNTMSGITAVIDQRLMSMQG